MHARQFLLGLVVLLATAGAAVGVASAHDTKTVAGYEVTFGGSDEPVITGERMWLQVDVVDADTGDPVGGLGDSLRMAVQRPFGDDVRELDAGGVHGQTGVYQAAVVFTEPGTYTVFVNATIDGTDVGLTFQKSVHDASDLRYPATSSSANRGLMGSVAQGATGVALGTVVGLVAVGAAFVTGRRF